MKSGPTSTAGPQSSQNRNPNTPSCCDFESASTKSSQLQSKRRRHGNASARAALRSGRRELAIYDGTKLVGIIKIAVDGK
jgi:hypothetical protein